MAWTTPRTWVTGETVTAAILNSHVRDNFDYVYATDRVHAYQTGNQNIADSTWDCITWDAEVYDTNSMHATGANNSRVVAPVAAFYIVVVKLTFEADADGRRAVMLRKNAGASSSGGNDLGLVNIASAGAGSVTVVTKTRMLSLGAGDYVEAFGYHNAGETRYVALGQDDSYLQLARIGS